MHSAHIQEFENRICFCLLQVTALSGYLYKFSKDERRVKLQEALAGFAPPRYTPLELLLLCPTAQEECMSGSWRSQQC